MDVYINIYLDIQHTYRENLLEGLSDPIVAIWATVCVRVILV